MDDEFEILPAASATTGGITGAASQQDEDEFEILPAANQGTEKPALSPRAVAFGRSFLDAAMPLTRYADAVGMKSGGQVATIKEGLTKANERADQEIAQDSTAAKIGTGLGMVAGGFLGGLASSAATAPAKAALTKGLTQLTAKETAAAVSAGITDLAGLALEGGTYAVLFDQPKTVEEAFDSWKKGSSIAAALGLGLKGTVLAGKAGAKKVGNALESLDETLQSGVKERQARDIAHAEQGIQLRERQLGRAEETVTARQQQLKQTKNELERSRALVAQEPVIDERVSLLPTRINDHLDEHIADVNQQITKKVQEFGKQEIDILPSLKAAREAIEAKEYTTARAKSAKAQAISLLDTLENGLYTPGSKTTDPITGLTKEVPAQIKKVPVAKAYQMKQQIQDLLYDKDFLENAPKGTELRKNIVNMERGLRNTMYKVDPTGEFAAYGDLQHNLLNARLRDGFDVDAPAHFKSRALNPNDPAATARYRQFERNLMSKEEIESKYGKSLADDAGLSPESMKRPEIKGRVEAIRKLIDAESTPAMQDYAVLQRTKPRISQLENKAMSLEARIEAGRVAVENRGRSVENAKLGLTKLKEDMPRNSLEALLPAKLRIALKARQKVNDNQSALSTLREAFSNSPTAQGGKILLESAGRGAATRGPAMLGHTEPERSGSLTIVDESEGVTERPALNELNH
jgi:hypothetical protein